MRYLTTAEVAERYRTAESTVRYWRHLQKGPRGIKVGKRVLYPEAELAALRARADRRRRGLGPGLMSRWPVRTQQRPSARVRRGPEIPLHVAHP